ncbi:MAG: YdeI/OmpD-associated family protein [Pseudomonadota bacterium]|uniref:YdeI/OmpD-associated family protein n=1 Tax=Polaromonas sp. TaxID=1869339 RepID=UPI001801787B|nr:YdeI/OmpD-associated family protein [Polaromonas sp.]MBA3594511.1 YdeI/OmpD-associated family protein [Polaromonas sp.]MDQ3271394.1 YdeI/OmpD-associated family protein [Pseudomonadota bacterium]
MSPTPAATTHKGEAILQFRYQAEWAQWLDTHHAGKAVWVRHAKKGAPAATLTSPEALEVALCFGWIDGQRNAESVHYYLQRWCPRGPRSIWSQINKDKALGYIQSGHMQPAGLAEIERARADGRWDAAYAPASKAEIPLDLLAALAAQPGAAEFFATVSAQNCYAVLFRIQTAKKPETRALRIEHFAQMLARGETVYPQGARKPNPAGA